MGQHGLIKVIFPMRLLSYVSLALALCSAMVRAEDPRHDELRQLRDEVFKAYEARDLEGLLKYVHPNVLVTWQNGEQNFGVDQLRSFYKVMMQGDAPIVRDVKSELIIDQLATLHEPNTAIAGGTLKDQFKLNSGLNFHLNSQWSATLVKESDGWKIASFHVSGNLFDNPLLSAAKAALWSVGGIAAALGLIIGFILGKRRRSTTAQ